MILPWKRDDDPDAEYNQQTATTPKGVKLIVFSDRDGTEWAYQVGDGPTEFGLDTRTLAMTAAEAAANQVKS